MSPIPAGFLSIAKSGPQGFPAAIFYQKSMKTVSKVMILAIRLASSGIYVIYHIQYEHVLDVGVDPRPKAPGQAVVSGGSGALAT